jgi:hypothetical protein
MCRKSPKTKQMMDLALFEATASCHPQRLQQLSTSWNSSITQDDWLAVIETEGHFADVQRAVRWEMKSDPQHAR